MKILLKNECDRAFKNKWFYITMFVCIAIVVYDFCMVALPTRLALEDVYIGMKDYQVPGVYSRWIEMNIGSSVKLIHFAFPLITCIPYAMSLYSDVKSKYIYNIITRVDKKKYFLTKIFVQFMVGFSVVAITLSLSFVLTAMVLPMEYPLISASVYLSTPKCVLVELFTKCPLATTILAIFLESVIFGIINCIAYVFAYILDNGIVVVTSAFTVYFFIHIISQITGLFGLMNCTRILMLNYSYVPELGIELLIIIGIVVLTYVLRSRAKDNI